MAENKLPSAPASPGAFFDHSGTRYFLREITQNDKREVQGLAFANALELTRTAVKYMDEKEGNAELAEVRRMRDAGYFWWDGEGGWAYRHSFPGLVRIVQMCLRRTELKNPIDDGLVTLEAVKAMGCDAEGDPTAEGFKFLLEKYNDANPTRPRPTVDRGTKDSTPNSPSSGDEAQMKLVG